MYRNEKTRPVLITPGKERGRIKNNGIGYEFNCDIL
jgi:hypothetical protein